MKINWRKAYVGGIALQAVVVAFLIYLYFNPTTKIQLAEQPPEETAPQESDEQISRVGSVGIGSADTVKFVDFNKDKTVSREFGFEKLLHRTDRQWHVENPFMNIYQDRFRCRITADKAVALTSESGTPPAFKEATLIGNVLVKIMPLGDNSIGPVTIYLDDIVFLSDRSLFLTAGPVKVIGKDAQLLGRGLELVYNYQANRLELLRIIHLETLCLNRVPKHKALAQQQTESIKTKDSSVIADAATEDMFEKYQAVFSGNVTARTASQMIFADDRLNIINIIRAKQSSSETPKQTRQSEPANAEQTSSTEDDGFMDVIVTCENGLIISPMGSFAEKIGFLPIARRQSRLGREKAGEIRDSSGLNVLLTHTITYDAAEHTAAASGKSELTFYMNDTVNQPGQSTPITIETSEQITFDRQTNQVVFDGNCLCHFVRAEADEFRKYTLAAPRLIVDLAEQKARKEHLAPAGVKHIAADGGTTVQVFSERQPQPLASFSSPRIDFYPDSQLIRAAGSSKLDFLVKSSDKPDSVSPAEFLPATITADESTQFDLAANTVTFKGNCYCRMTQTAAANPQTYSLKAQKITASLSDDKKQSDSSTSGDIKKLTATGQAVVSITAADSDKKSAEFIAERIVYDSQTQNITADGPSRLEMFTNLADDDTQQASTPVTITAQSKASFSLALNQAIFHGQCVCTAIRIDGQIPRKYILTAPELVVSMAKNRQLSESAYAIESLTAGDNAAIIVTPVDSMTELATFRCPKIKYSAAGRNIIADGPCDFHFYANDFMPTETLGAAVPVTITTKQSTTFLPEENRILFKGDCLCMVVRARGNFQNKYTLAAELITIKLSKDKHPGPTASALGIEHVTADGGKVQLSNIKTSDDKLREFSRLKCQSVDFDAPTKLFSAAGPGIITVDNSKTYQPNKNTNSFSLNRQCYAFLRDFDSLKYHLAENKITAQSKTGKMLLDYFPIDEDQSTEQAKASAGIVTINLSESDNGPSEISSLLAGNGITYEDNKNQFSAGRFTYDFTSSTIRAYADDFHRCYLNGAIVDNVVYNIKQGTALSLEMKDPGMMQTNR